MREADRRLFYAYRRSGDPAHRETLVVRSLPLAAQLASRYAGSTTGDDLFQVACVGLVNAVDRFDPDRRTEFSTFAVPTILGEIKRYFRDKSSPVRVPRREQELALKVDRVADRLTAELQRAPSHARLADEMAVSVEQLLGALETVAACRATSLEAARTEGEEETVGDSIGCCDEGYGQAEQRALLERPLQALDERDREVIQLRFWEDLTQQEIADRIGLSQMQVSRILRRAIARLREVAEAPVGRALAPPAGRA
jgi:RNA polymerase sigma-B factor